MAAEGRVVCIDERMDEAAEESNLGLLAEATRAAIDKLQERGDKGFFLMVEGAKIDYAGHSRCLPRLGDRDAQFRPGRGRSAEVRR